MRNDTYCTYKEREWSVLLFETSFQGSITNTTVLARFRRFCRDYYPIIIGLFKYCNTYYLNSQSKFDNINPESRSILDRI